MSYQRRVGKFLLMGVPNERLFAGQWISFVDSNGFGYAQPDFYVVWPDFILCFECKLSQCPEGFSQISQLYRPLLEKIYSRPVSGVLVCKFLTEEPKEQVSPSGFRAIRPGTETLWHFMG